MEISSKVVSLSKEKGCNVLSNLHNTASDELLNLVLVILSKPDVMLSARDHTELDQINVEFMRRGHADLQVVK